MPELPEVEIARQNLERWLRGRKVIGAEAEKTRIFRGSRRQDFTALRGAMLESYRKGKYLMLTFEGGRGVLAHLGMTGKFVRRAAGQGELYSRARLLLDNDSVIHFTDPRMFGRLQPARADRLRSLPAIRQLGIDPVTERLTPSLLREALGTSRQPIKVALLDQSRIAGLGNIHAAEALFRARIHPARKPQTLKPPEWTRLCRSIHQAIRFALDRQSGEDIEYVEEPGTENPFLIYGRAGEKCRRCGTPIRSFVQAGRTTYFCSKDQPRRSSA